MTKEDLIKLNKERRKQLVGKKFGRLEVLKEDGKTINGFTYTCKCDCGNFKYKVRTNSLSMGRIKSCGCSRKENLDELKKRLKSKIKINGDCWEWQGYIALSGYGNVKSKQKTYIAHRLFYEIFVGEIKEKELILHKCDNRKCCNPDHLYIGDYTQNMKDMIERNRTNQSGLTPEDILEIRNLYPKFSYDKIAALYDVSNTTIWKIIKNMTWTHV